MNKLFLITVFLLFSPYLYASAKTGSDTAAEMEKFKQGMAVLEYIGEMGIATENCQQKYPGVNAKDKNMGSCLITALYPLAEQGNYMAALMIADVYGELGYPEEQSKWVEYTLSMENLPNDIKTEIEEGLVQLENKNNE